MLLTNLTQNVPLEEASGHLSGPSWHTLEALGAPLSPLGAPLGPSWGPLGALYAFRKHLGTSPGHLDAL